MNDNNSNSHNKNKYCTNNETKSVLPEDTASFTSDDESSKLQDIMESYTPYKDGNKTSTQQASNSWIDIFESDDEDNKKDLCLVL